MAEPRFHPDDPEVQVLLSECPILMHRLHAAGLHRAGHAMHEVVRVIGWEVEGELSKKLVRRGTPGLGATA